MRVFHRVIRRDLSYFTLVSVVVLILASAALIFYNQQVIEETQALQKQTEAVKASLSYGFDQTTRDIDISLRGYAIMRADKYLYISNEEIRSVTEASFRQLDSLLAAQGFQDPAGVQALQKYQNAIRDYIDYHKLMVDLIRQDNMQTFKELFAEDRGDAIWTDFDAARTVVNTFEDGLHQEAGSRYAWAARSNRIVQLLLVFAGLPIILMVMRRLHQESRKRQALLLQLEDNNHRYLFHAGADATVQTAEEVIANSIGNLQKAAAFVTHVTAGDYSVDWEGLNDRNQHLNEATLAGKLVKMREQMKQVKEEEAKRAWSSEGVARFSTLVRNHQHDRQRLAEEAVRFLTKYLQAQQGSLFVAVTDENQETSLQLAACYAFDRKKFVEKRIAIGSGLIGQTYLEGETVVLTEVPQGYTTITSGLGDATPACVIIIPMKYNDTTQALLELASFESFEPYQVEFLEKCGEFVASALLSARNTEQMKAVLEQSQEQAEMLKAQEEEMRQNIEELAATQEEMSRKSQEAEQREKQLEQEHAEQIQRAARLAHENRELRAQLALQA